MAWCIIIKNDFKEIINMANGNINNMPHNIIWKSICNKVFYDIINLQQILYPSGCFNARNSSPVLRYIDKVIKA